MEIKRGNVFLNISTVFLLKFWNSFKTFDVVCCVLVTGKMHFHFHFHFSGSNEVIRDHCISKEQILDSTVP